METPIFYLPAVLVQFQELCRGKVQEHGAGQVRWLDLGSRSLTPDGAGGWSSVGDRALVGTWVRRVQLGGWLKHYLGAAGQLPGWREAQPDPPVLAIRERLPLAWFPKARHSQGQHAVTSWDLGIVVPGPRQGSQPFPQSPLLPGQSLVCSERPFHHEIGVECHSGTQRGRW